jgi:hypothetical protein
MNPLSILSEDGMLVLFQTFMTISQIFRRHPLQEQAVDTFVSNSASLVGGAGTNSQFAGYRDQQQTDGTLTWNSVVVCTGANACGKVSPLQAAFIKLVDSLRRVFI